MKSSASPCPLDQLSIICFKRFPYLRSYLTNIIHEIWKSQAVPTTWKKACTILIHKKGNTSDPSNFRPITLQSVPLKVFTSTSLNKRFKKASPQRYQVPLSIQFKCQPLLIRHVSNNALLSSPCWTSRMHLEKFITI